MGPEPKKLHDDDPGFNQFMKNHDQSVADLQGRLKVAWEMEKNLNIEEQQEREAMVRAEGIAEGVMKSVLKWLEKAKSAEELAAIADDWIETGFPEDTVNAAREQVAAERGW
jgi:hypothetical protein